MIIFKQEITEDNRNAYVSNWSTSVLNVLSRDIVEKVVIPDDCPNYIKESIHKFVK